jgi:hypothetical protein
MMAEKEKTELFLFNLFKHEHKWSEVDDKGYQTCSKCNEKKLIGLGKCKHTWTEPEERKMVCSECGEVREVACSHEWKKTDNNTIECIKCGAVEVTPCDHTWEDVEGERFQRCSKCGDKLTFNCPHEWEDLDANTQRCKICGEKETVTCAHTYGEPQEDGYQYCSKCHIAKLIEQKCDHEFVRTDKLVNSDSKDGKGIKYHIFTYECLKCGTAKAVKVDYESL